MQAAHVMHRMQLCALVNGGGNVRDGPVGRDGEQGAIVGRRPNALLWQLVDECGVSEGRLA
jgi:hypothetical protein